jgi:hypothetical protein
VHAPQLAVRDVLQLSLALTSPQFLPRREQKVGFVSGTHPQMFDVTAPHVCGKVQLPQLAVRDAPQLSVPKSDPQFLLPKREQNAASVSVVQPHTLTVPPPPQVTPVPEQAPQLAVRGAPQLSLAMRSPQFLPRREQNTASFSVTHPQTFGVTAPQVLGAVHVPHASVPPHPFASEPQSLPRPKHVVGVQPQTFVVPPPPHDCGVVHVPQSAVREVPQLSLPKREPQFLLPSRVQKAVSLSAVQPHTLAEPPPAHV